MRFNFAVLCMLAVFSSIGYADKITQSNIEISASHYASCEMDGSCHIDGSVSNIGLDSKLSELSGIYPEGVNVTGIFQRVNLTERYNSSEWVSNMSCADFVSDNMTLAHNCVDSGYSKIQNLSRVVERFQPLVISKVSGKDFIKKSDKIKLDKNDVLKYRISFQVPRASSGEFNISYGDVVLDPWWNTSWSYVRPITITNSSALSDYQVNILLNSSYIPNLNWSNSGNDLRFTYADNTTIIPYWIESWTNLSTSNASVWVKTNQSNINMYYGNPSATSQSNSQAIMTLYDNFNDGDYINTPTWTPKTASTWWVSPTGLFLKDNSTTMKDNIRANISTLENFSFEFDIYVETTAVFNQYMGLMNSTNAGYAFLYHDGGTNNYNIYSSTDWIGGTDPANQVLLGYSSITPSSAWHSMKLTKYGSNLSAYYDGVLQFSATNTLVNIFSQVFFFGGGTTGRILRYDNVSVRQYMFTEPTYSLGAEQTNGGAGSSCELLNQTLPFTISRVANSTGFCVAYNGVSLIFSSNASQGALYDLDGTLTRNYIYWTNRTISFYDSHNRCDVLSYGYNFSGLIPNHTYYVYQLKAGLKYLIYNGSTDSLGVLPTFSGGLKIGTTGCMYAQVCTNSYVSTSNCVLSSCTSVRDPDGWTTFSNLSACQRAQYSLSNRIWITDNASLDLSGPSLTFFTPSDNNQVGTPVSFVYQPTDGAGFSNCSLWYSYQGQPFSLLDVKRSGILNNSLNIFTKNLQEGERYSSYLFCTDNGINGTDFQSAISDTHTFMVGETSPGAYVAAGGGGGSQEYPTLTFTGRVVQPFKDGVSWLEPYFNKFKDALFSVFKYILVRLFP